jgi:IS30 family transposase
MKNRKRIYYSESQKALMWDRWQKGDSLHAIARLFDRGHSSISRILGETGGIRPPTRKRTSRSLTLDERETISRGIAKQHTLREIAQQLGRSPSTVSREVKRNGGDARYRASSADQAAWQRTLRPKRCKLAGKPDLVKVITQKLQAEQWSPQQVAGWLKRRYPKNEYYHVSHETIYKSLFIQARGVLKKELLACLRTQRIMRRSKHASLKGLGLGKIVDAVPISERPASVEDRAVPGHWEGDLIAGTNNSYIATLVERQTRYVMLAHVKNKNTATVVQALIKQSQKLPSELYKSLTWDRGSEMSGHKKFTLATDIQVYFCDPKSPWQRGSNENTNRLLRQYFPKGTNLSEHSQVELDRVARQLNERPRKTLDYETPAERFNQCVASTG